MTAKKAAIFPKTAEIPDKQMMDAAKNLAAKIHEQQQNRFRHSRQRKTLPISTHTCPNRNMVKKMPQEARM